MVDLSKLTNIIFSVYEECNIQKFPVDCFKILRHYGFKIKTYSQLKFKNPELYKLCITYSNDAFSDTETRFIAYNDKAHKRRIRFSLMHELGHFILGHTVKTKEVEDEADMFASHILVPRSAMVETECLTADRVHDVFDVSYAAANRCRADYLKCVDDYPQVLWDDRITKRFFPNAPRRQTPEEFLNTFFGTGSWMCVSVKIKKNTEGAL